MKKTLFFAALIIGLLLPLKIHAQAKIKFDNTLHNFGAIDETGGDVTHDFVFTNIGDKQLIILDVNTNCGCTKTNIPQAPIAPGEKGKISITFQPKGNAGEFAKEIIVKSNGSKKKSRLRIKGLVIPQQQ